MIAIKLSSKGGIHPYENARLLRREEDLILLCNHCGLIITCTVTVYRDYALDEAGLGHIVVSCTFNGKTVVARGDYLPDQLFIGIGKLSEVVIEQATSKIVRTEGSV